MSIRKTRAIQIKLEIMYSQSFPPTLHTFVFLFSSFWWFWDWEERSSKRKKERKKERRFPCFYAEKNKLKMKKGKMKNFSCSLFLFRHCLKRTWTKEGNDDVIVDEIKEMFPFFWFISLVVTVWLNDNVHWACDVIKLEGFHK